jgi:acetylornithine deacetylase/succinyl-diaminopimelate desuccinylase-like protein
MISSLGVPSGRDAPAISGTDRAAHRNASQAVDGIVELTERLIQVPTFETVRCADAMVHVHHYLERAGFEVTTHLPRNELGEAFPIVVGTLGGSTNRPDALLCAHIDTSPPGEGWTKQPFGAERDGGLIFGRGAAVSKSSIGVFAAAAAAAWDGAVSLPRRAATAVAVTSDEGRGGDLGVGYLLRDLGYRPSIAIFPGVADAITITHHGCIQLKVTVTGTACHQSLLPEDEDAMRFVTRLCSTTYALSPAPLKPGASGLPMPSVNVTKIIGGTDFGMAPRQVEVWIDRRVSPLESTEHALADLNKTIEESRQEFSGRVDCQLVRKAEPMRASERQTPFVSVLKRAASQGHGIDLPTIGSTLYTDARWFSGVGIPTLMYGPAESDIKKSGANGVDERVSIDLIEKSATVLARALFAWITRDRV